MVPLSERSIQDVTWRAQVEARVRDLEGELDRVRERDPAPKDSWSQVADYTIAKRNIKQAEVVAACVPRLLSWKWLRRWASGSDVETAWGAIHRAEAALQMILDPETLKARLPDLRAALSSTLAGDGRLDEYNRTLEQVETRGPADIGPEERERVRVVKSAIDATSDAAYSNIRNYRNWLLMISAIVTAGLIGLAIIHSRNSEFLYIPEAHSSGTQSADVAQIAAAGALGGLLMALFALTRLTVYSGPVALPLWQALVRVPAGAAAGLVGAVLLQSHLFNAIVPQTRTGLLGYAVLFGAAPEILLRFLDDRVNAATAAARPKNDPLKGVPPQKAVPPANGGGGNDGGGNGNAGHGGGGGGDEGTGGGGTQETVAP
jgi:uncharacterized membrane protein YgcG